MSNYFSIKQIAKQLGVSPMSIRRWYKVGSLKGVRVGTMIRFTDVDVAAFIQASEQKQEAK